MGDNTWFPVLIVAVLLLLVLWGGINRYSGEMPFHLNEKTFQVSDHTFKTYSCIRTTTVR